MNSESYLVLPEIGDVPAFPVSELKESDWGDGLIVRSPNWLGDAVMAIPAMLELRAVIPPFCGLFVLCPKGFAPVFESLEFIDRVLPLSNPHAFMTAEERRSVNRLHAGAGVIFNNSFRDALDLRLARIPKLFGAKARFRSWLLTRSFEFPKRRDFELNKPHQAAKYMAIARAIGGKPWNGILPEFKMNLQPEICPPELAQFCRNSKILVIAGGAAYGAAKRWPSENFREIARRWINEGGFVAAVGSQKERPIADEILADLDSAHCWNAAGKTSMDGLIYLLKHAEMCVANDSGVMHLAAALGVPGVAPFGCTDPAATSPVSTNWKIAFRKIECSPCFKRVCPKGTKECFADITPDVVWKMMKAD